LSGIAIREAFSSQPSAKPSNARISVLFKRTSFLAGSESLYGLC
jgi:hypothetical protein